MSVEVDAAALKATVQRILDNRPDALKAAGLVLLADAQQTIHDGGQAWAPFKTLPKRPHQLLWDTGTLIQSLALGGAGNVFEQTGDTVTVGTNVAYAAAQNYGYEPRNLPARPFLFIDDEREQQASNAYSKALLKGVTS